MLEADTYWVKTQSASFLYQIGLRMRGQVMARAKEVRAPALVVQGEGDVVVSQPATKQYFETLGSADKTFKTYPGYSHDCEFETGPLGARSGHRGLDSRAQRLAANDPLNC